MRLVFVCVGVNYGIKSVHVHVNFPQHDGGYLRVLDICQGPSRRLVFCVQYLGGGEQDEY